MAEPDDTLDVQPPVPVAPTDALGLPPLEQAIGPAPVIGPVRTIDPNRRRMEALVALAAGLAGGRNATIGAAQGLTSHWQQEEKQRALDASLANQVYARQIAEYGVKAHAYEQEAGRRQQMFRDSIQNFQRQIATGQIKTQEQYDQYVGLLGASLRAQGVRIDDNALRGMARFYPADESAAMADALAKVDARHKAEGGVEALPPTTVVTYKGSDGTVRPITLDKLIDQAGHTIGLARQPDGTLARSPAPMPKDKIGLYLQDVEQQYQWLREQSGGLELSREDDRKLRQQARDMVDAREVKRESDLAKAKADPEVAQLKLEKLMLDIRLERERLQQALNKPGIKLSPTQQSDLADMNTLSQLAQEVVAQGQKTGWSGVGGLGRGTIESFLQKQFGRGSPQSGELRATISNIQGTLAKLRGGTSFTPNEQRLLEQYTPTINEDPVSIMAKLSALQGFLARKATNVLQVAGGDAAGIVQEIQGRTTAPPAGLLTPSHGAAPPPAGPRSGKTASGLAYTVEVH